jgi:GNAT superfamily N-acetyltransferase
MKYFQRLNKYLIQYYFIILCQLQLSVYGKYNNAKGEIMCSNEVEIRLIMKYEWNDLLNICPTTDINFKTIYSIVNLMDNSLETKKHTYVALIDELIIGFVYGVTIPGNTLIPQFLYVKDSFRKCGFGTKLMKRLEEGSDCSTSIIYYEKSLHNYYKSQNYFTGDNLEVAIKNINGF